MSDPDLPSGVRERLQSTLLESNITEGIHSRGEMIEIMNEVNQIHQKNCGNEKPNIRGSLLLSDLDGRERESSK